MRPAPKTDKILITLPFWDGDKAQAMRLARFIADLQPSGASGAADFLFVARQDCKHDKETVAYVSRKFNTFTHTSTRPERGWPLGCGGTFFATVDWSLRNISAAKCPAYKAIFVCEADVTPLTRDALLYLHARWDAAKKKNPNLSLAGALVPEGPHGHAHINGGCCLVDADLKFLHWLVARVGGCLRGGGGWDWALAGEFQRKGWFDIDGIKSWWQTPSIAPGVVENLKKEGVIFLHGVKDNSGLEAARKILL